MLQHAIMKPPMSFSNRDNVLTRSTIEKLDRAISYIRENYDSDISREGLAALVEMHPDSLSRFFNIYTGKRIKEFINSCRVEEAAERLQNSSEMITAIALRVGFESLSTFNRAFLKEMKISPTEYRSRSAMKNMRSENRG